MRRLEGKAVLVVGGGADGPPAKGETLAIGNGRATAIQCAREGASVMVADRNFASATQTAEAIAKEGGRAAAVICDLMDEALCIGAVQTTIDRFGALHGLVNSAAITDMTDVIGTSLEEFDRVMQVNVSGFFVTTKAAMPAIAGAGGGAIVNVSSLAALRSGAGSGVAYDTSKASLLALTRNSALTGAPLKVRVNAVLPGIINSTILRRYVGDREIDFGSRIPMRRTGTPWEIAKVIVFLLSDSAAFITGTDLVVDGGVAAALT